MAIGLDASRASRRRVCNPEAGTRRPTIREVRLLGINSHPRGEAWSIGQRVTWLGRGYRVVAVLRERIAELGSTCGRRGVPGSRIEPASVPAEGRHYVHLASCGER